MGLRVADIRDSIHKGIQKGSALSGDGASGGDARGVTPSGIAAAGGGGLGQTGAAAASIAAEKERIRELERLSKFRCVWVWVCVCVCVCVFVCVCLFVYLERLSTCRCVDCVGGEFGVDCMRVGESVVGSVCHVSHVCGMWCMVSHTSRFQSLILI